MVSSAKVGSYFGDLHEKFRRLKFPIYPSHKRHQSQKYAGLLVIDYQHYPFNAQNGLNNLIILASASW
jgi:hypothetical protein